MLNSAVREHEVDVYIPYGKLKDVFTWCTVNCDREWHISPLSCESPEIANYTFHFSSDRDLMMFTLKWK